MRAQHFEFALSRASGRSLASIHGQGERRFPLHPVQTEYLLAIVDFDRGIRAELGKGGRYS